MTPTEKAIRDFCGHHADWWPSTTQVQEMLALAQPCLTCEALARTVMLDQTSHDAQRKPLTDKQILADDTLRYHFGLNGGAGPVSKKGKSVIAAIESAHGIKE